MESNEFLSSLSPILRRHIVPLILGVVGLLLIVFGSLPFLFSRMSGPEEVVFEAGAESADSTHGSVLGRQDSIPRDGAEAENSLQIDVSGAVASPGVYVLSSASRVQEAIAAAGGFASTANTAWIARNLNLAAKLSDASKLYIPFVGEQGMISVDEGGMAHVGDKVGLININTASQAQIEALPGVGPVTAAKIINGRPYRSVEDLLAKKVVGQSVFGKIKDQILAE